MADKVLILNVSRIEADHATAIGKKAFFFNSFANALAAVDDDDPAVATGIQAIKAVGRLDNSVGAAIAAKFVEIDLNGDIVVSLDDGADKWMVIPQSGKGNQPTFIPVELLV